MGEARFPRHIAENVVATRWCSLFLLSLRKTVADMGFIILGDYGGRRVEPGLKPGINPPVSPPPNLDQLRTRLVKVRRRLRYITIESAQLAAAGLFYYPRLM